MRGALKIFLAAYFPLLLAAASDLALDFRPAAFGSPLFQALFWLWLLDGSACLVAGVGVCRELWLTRFAAPGRTGLALLALTGVLLGIAPASILLELSLKFFQYVRL